MTCGGLNVFFTLAIFIACTVITIYFMAKPFHQYHFYEVFEGSTVSESPFRILLGILGYCVIVGDSPCVGPPRKVGWNFEKVGSYLNMSVTTHVEELQTSIHPTTTRGLAAANITLLLCSLCGLVATSIVYWKWITTGTGSRIQTKRLLKGLMYIAALTLGASLAQIAVAYVTGSKIGDRINKATQGKLHLIKINGHAPIAGAVKNGTVSDGTEVIKTRVGLLLLIVPVTSILAISTSWLAIPDKPPAEQPDTSDQIGLTVRNQTPV